MQWRAESLRSVIYGHPTGTVPDALGAWSKIIGTSPDSSQRFPVGPVSHSQATGAVDSFNVSIGSQLARLEIMVGPKVTPGGPPDDIVDVEAGAKLIRDLTRRAAESLAVGRLAYVHQLLQAVPDTPSAVDLLVQLVPGLPLSRDAEDAIFQMNRPKAIAFSPGAMNRLCKWASVKQQIIEVQISGSQNQPFVVHERHVAQFMVDVSTLPMAAPMEQGEVVPALDLLAEEVDALAAGGYKYLIQ